MPRTTIFSATKIITMNPSRPFASHVAVRDGRIVAAGSLAELERFGEYELNEDFADKVLMPGFVEGHAHCQEGSMWQNTYIGYGDRYDSQGNLWRGSKSMQAAIDVLKRAESKMSDAKTPLFAWGFDPIYFGTERMSTKHLDEVSKHRAVLVTHSNGHALNVNSVVLSMANITAASNVHGIVKTSDGSPSGELLEMAAQYMAYRHTGKPLFDEISTATLRLYAQSSVNCGVTTATDLYANFNDGNLQSYQQVSQQSDYPLRLVPAMNSLLQSFDEGIAKMHKAVSQSNDRLYHGICKIMTDGSIQAFSARLQWPGYFNGASNGVWNMPPSQLTETVMAYHRAGFHLHIHTNGNEASQLMIDAIEKALLAHPRADHRHTLQHAQMLSGAQFRRMAKLGICANLFANHIYYWGDQHYGITMGPERASCMNACRTAQNSGVNFAIHSDAPVTPLAPLFTAWCASNRLTSSGFVLGENERIEVASALHAITLGAAYTLKLDHLVGSIESGKYADFAVLDDDPLAVGASGLKDIGIWGTISAGVAYKAATRRQ